MMSTLEHWLPSSLRTHFVWPNCGDTKWQLKQNWPSQVTYCLEVTVLCPEFVLVGRAIVAHFLPSIPPPTGSTNHMPGFGFESEPYSLSRLSITLTGSYCDA